MYLLSSTRLLMTSTTRQNPNGTEIAISWRLSTAIDAFNVWGRDGGNGDGDGDGDGGDNVDGDGDDDGDDMVMGIWMG